MDEDIKNINRLPLQNPEERAAYERKNPPLELLKLSDCYQYEFADNRSILPLLRLELSEFLASQGEEVRHPSDLTCQDFSRDFSSNPFLDEDEV